MNDLCVKFLENIYQFMLIPYSNLICLKSFKKISKEHFLSSNKIFTNTLSNFSSLFLCK